ncbi:hypothetical protein CF327_g4365 [Tilletia walkeri]|nr:hypothetical protein CF327_g4365 [Tilletia walkeri]
MDTWVLVWFLAAVAMGLYLGVNRDGYRRAKQKAGAAKANADRGGRSIDVRILDLCTGSGCIAVLLAHRLHKLASKPSLSSLKWQVMGIDISPIALQLATQNASLMNLPTQSIHFHQADIFSPQQMDNIFHLTFGPSSSPPNHAVQVNMILSNPPYITPADYASSSPAQIDASVREWEDIRALVGVHPDHLHQVVSQAKDEDEKAGLTFYRRINSLMTRHAALLPPSSSTLPRLVLEVGHQGQAQRVVDIFSNPPLSISKERSSPQPPSPPRIQRDAWGVDRVVEVF